MSTQKELILEKLSDLEGEELEAVLDILQKKKQDKEKHLDTEKEEGTIKRKRRRRKKNTKRDNPGENARNRSRVKKLTKNPHGKKDKGKPPKIISFDTNKKRPDLFTQRGFADLHKDDVETDRKLWGNKKPTPRTRTSLVEVECDKCGKTHVVNQSLVYVDPDGDYSYVCDNCIGG